jgi:hypothetical protein
VRLTVVVGFVRVERVVLVKRPDLTRVVSYQRVCPVAVAVRQAPDQVMNFACVADVAVLVFGGEVAVVLDVPLHVRCAGPDGGEMPLELCNAMRGGLGDVGRHGVVGGAPRVVGLDAHEPDLVGVRGVVAPEPAQHGRHLAGLVLVAHAPHELADVARAGADVPVDEQARRPVLFPGDGAEADPLDQQAKHAMLDRGLLRGPVDGFAQAHDERVADRAPDGSQVTERACRVDEVERDRVVADPADDRLVPRRGVRQRRSAQQRDEGRGDGERADEQTLDWTSDRGGRGRPPTPLSRRRRLLSGSISAARPPTDARGTRRHSDVRQHRHRSVR